MTTADLSPLYNNLLCVGRGLPCQPFLLLPSRGWSDSSTSNSAPGTRSQGEPSPPHGNTAANSERPTCTMCLTKPYGPVPGASSWSWPKSNAPGFCSWALYSCLSWHRHGWDQVVAFSTWEVQAEQKGWLWGARGTLSLKLCTKLLAVLVGGLSMFEKNCAWIRWIRGRDQWQQGLVQSIGLAPRYEEAPICCWWQKQRICLLNRVKQKMEQAQGWGRTCLTHTASPRAVHPGDKHDICKVV